MKFAIPRIWHELTDHSSNFYFCMMDPFKRRVGKNVSAIIYPDLPSSITPVPHCPELPVPTRLERKQASSEESSKSVDEVDVEDPYYNFIPDGLQGGFIKFPYYRCFWDSRDITAHYSRKHWAQWTEFFVGKHNAKCEPLVDLEKVLFPPLHIKLGLMKQFVTALDKESAAFKYFRDFFPKMSEAKVKAGV
ncbi:uncharacterized protein LOC143223785 [Tachypleus tridentatus]|uniref:uncharacterized protein LOC143223785 n=1 Tax=Tachypleus tridentatus TaxID=6853 RepID=UPI003FD00989